MPLHLLLKRKALEAGFDIAGIAPVDVWSDLDFARRWAEEGYGGEMRYLQNPMRYDPRRVLASARSVVCVGLVYNAPLPYSTEAGRHTGSGQAHPGRRSPNGAPRAWISRYAWGQDYHELMRAKMETLRSAVEELVPGVETRVYVDTGPMVERAFARYSGIGWTGKNTCLINPLKGSWFFLGVILTSIEIEPDLPAADRCGSCTRCLDACPTGALKEPYVMDASRCIAYFNIELKGSIPEEYRAKIGANMFGCDICQDVCPWNKRPNFDSGSLNQVTSHRPPASKPQPAEKGFGRPGAATTSLPEFQPMEVGTGREDEEAGASRGFSLFNPQIELLAQMTEEDFRRAFRRSPIKRPKYRGWLRNLCVVMGNSGDKRFLPKIEELSRHSEPLVREHAEWAIAQINES